MNETYRNSIAELILKRVNKQAVTYLYRLENIETGRFYLGQRTIKGMTMDDAGEDFKAHYFELIKSSSIDLWHDLRNHHIIGSIFAVIADRKIADRIKNEAIMNEVKENGWNGLYNRSYVIKNKEYVGMPQAIKFDADRLQFDISIDDLRDIELGHIAETYNQINENYRRLLYDEYGDDLLIELEKKACRDIMNVMRKEA